MQEQTGKKFDQGKLPWQLLFERHLGGALEDVLRVVEFGAKKYGNSNWQLVENAKARYAAAAFRHLIAHAKGDLKDDESGLPHLAHGIVNLLFLLAFDRGLPVVEDKGPPATRLSNQNVLVVAGREAPEVKIAPAGGWSGGY